MYQIASTTDPQLGPRGTTLLLPPRRAVHRPHAGLATYKLMQELRASTVWQPDSSWENKRAKTEEQGGYMRCKEARERRPCQQAGEKLPQTDNNPKKG